MSRPTAESQTASYTGARLLSDIYSGREFMAQAHHYLKLHFPTLQPGERQDLIQDTLLRLLILDRRAGTRHFAINVRYQQRVLSTVALDFFRLRQRTKTRFLEFDPWSNDYFETYVAGRLDPDAAMGSRVPSVERGAVFSEYLEIALRQLDDLPQRQQSVVQLHMKGYSYNEIAESLGVSLSTVRNHLYAARQSLRKSLPEIARSLKQG